MDTPEPSPGAGILDLQLPVDGAPDDDDLLDAAPVAPPVVAVLVTSDPGPWLEDALASLATQEYPALSVLVLDNGSAEDPTPRIAAAMPGAFVRRLPANLGFAAAANDVIATVEGATFLLFCHDDVVIGPDAVRVMVEEAYRSNAGVVGPKLVDYEHPETLLEVGMAVDHYGVPFSSIEPGEVDQEQHDAVRDVFFVSNAVMLVRADLFQELGGFDAETFPGSDDIDLCWRARLVGARVIVAPDACVRHRRTTLQDERSPRRSRADLKVWTRGRVRVLMKSYSGLALVWVLPTAFILNAVESLGYLVTGRPKRAGALMAGWLSVVRQAGDIRNARASVQRLRRVDDGDVRDLMVRGSARVRTFTTQRLHAGDRLAVVSNRTRVAVSEARGRVGRAHVVAALVLAVVVAFGSRLLVLDRVAEIGAFGDWPGAGSLWSVFVSPWRYAMLGADAPAPPAFALMAGFSTLLLGDTDIGRTIVVAGALPLGAWGAFRLSRPLAASAAPGVVSAIAYAVNPIIRNAIAEGRLGPLVLFALAPWILAALLRVVTGDELDRPSRIHAALTVALLVLVTTAAWPLALLFPLVVALAFVLAVPLVGGGLAVRIAVVATVGSVGAFVLCAPWSISLIGADAATFGLFPQSPPALSDVLSFQTGASGSGFAAWGLLVAAMLPLAVARGPRLAWAARGWMLAAVSFALAWLPGRLDVAATPALEGVLVPAALGLALAAGLGAAAFLEELRTFHFGWRQAAPVAAAIGLALPFLGLSVDAWQGRWGMPGDDWAGRMSWIESEPAPGGFRVLWIGDPAVIPTDVKVVDGIGYGLTADGTGDARAQWAPSEGDAERVLADAIALTRAGRTVRFGHLIAPTGVRYIAFVRRGAPDAGVEAPPDPLLARALDEQLDLAISRLEPGATLYENEAWVPRRAVVPPETDVAPDARDPIAATQSAELSGAQGVTGPRSESTPVPPGTLLWAESADSGWQAEVDGVDVPRADAFGWTNGFDTGSGGRVGISFDGGWRRQLAIVELGLWIGAFIGWRRTRARRPERAA